jgi:dTDP-glucose 4,6-dehydratase
LAQGTFYFSSIAVVSSWLSRIISINRGDRDFAGGLAARKILIFPFLLRRYDIKRNDSIFRGQVKVAPMVGYGRISGAFPSLASPQYQIRRFLVRNLMVTGGAGFIGSNFVRYMLEKYPDYSIVVYDKLTYAGNLNNLRDVAERFADRYAFVQGDICETARVRETIHTHSVDTIINFAAETHVDRSIMDPDAFIKTDVYGTYVLLEATRELGLERMHQVSTDEVYGHVPEGASKETDPIAPRSPYAASKASGDMMVNAYHITYDLPVTITRGANNIGPYQYPEKVVPLFTTNAIDDLPMPLYGDGLQVRDYQYVLDHCEAIDIVLHRGKIGGIYNIGTGTEMRNIDMTRLVLKLLDKPESLIQPVRDRPGHDRRYALNVTKICGLGWEPAHSCEEAIEQTVRWYVENEWWWRPIKSGEHYQEYYKRQYKGREIG